MRKPLMCAAILALTCAPVYGGNVKTFHGSAKLAQDEKPMGGSNAAWIVPFIAIIAIAAMSRGNGEMVKESEPKCLGGGGRC